jgi:starch synthase (maltosyl-transferring)
MGDHDDKGQRQMSDYTNRSHLLIERVSPVVDGGRYPVKSVVGDSVEVRAECFRHGAELVSAALRYFGPSDERPREKAMRRRRGDVFTGSFDVAEMGMHHFNIEAWTDVFGTWRRDLVRRLEAGQDVALELEEGAAIVSSHLGLVPDDKKPVLERALEVLTAGSSLPATGPRHPGVAAALDEELLRTIRSYPDRTASVTLDEDLPVWVDRPLGRTGAWYEFFPRSTGSHGEHGTFKTAMEILPPVAEARFDVVYLPPIHPIGSTNRKGKNNSLESSVTDVGSPWAIGNIEGGHTAIHPQLGTFEDFEAFVSEAGRLGLDVALDYAIQCSPDHPWVKEHPEWFNHRPDSSIKYAENPPKKYQDVYPVNFDTPGKDALWNALKDALFFWIKRGIKVFRVDNPHTKPFAFWEWLIDAVREEYPEVIFLAEAFTEANVMKALSKLGFTQSYTYFTWTNTKEELEKYMTELTKTDMRHYFRPNFFTNTPDILHAYLASGGEPAFRIRLALAATLSPSYGIYSGFELFENTPVEPKSEEYLHSEKYELKHRTLDLESGLMPFIVRINEIRREHPSLQILDNIEFHETRDDDVIAYTKTSGRDTVLVVANLNPKRVIRTRVRLDLEAAGLPDARRVVAKDLFSGRADSWSPDFRLTLDPARDPVRIFALSG